MLNKWPSATELDDPTKPVRRNLPPVGCSLLAVGSWLLATPYRLLGLFSSSGFEEKLISPVRKHKMRLNSFRINKTRSKSSSIFLVFCRFFAIILDFCAKIGPFFDPNAP
jgi:hypothetical protein